MLLDCVKAGEELTFIPLTLLYCFNGDSAVDLYQQIIGDGLHKEVWLCFCVEFASDWFSSSAQKQFILCICQKATTIFISDHLFCFKTIFQSLDIFPESF